MIVMPMPVTEVRVFGARLLAEYAAECSIPALGETNPQWEMYEMLQASGKLRVFGAYHIGLIGFATVLLSELPHYGVRAGIVESLFVGSAYRKTGAGRLLMMAVEEAARYAGCKGVLYSAPVGGKLEKVLDADTSVSRTNTVFFKALGRVD
jgi:GNAT superfamily N-acetyltransferase